MKKDKHTKNQASEDHEAKAKKKTEIDPKEYAELQVKVAELEAMKEKWIRSAADFENAKKRLSREREEFVKFGQESLNRELLAILDNFERALDHVQEDNLESLKGVASGIQMVFKQLCGILKNQGLKRLEALGKPFDPHLHEAIAYVQEDGKEDEIVDEIQAGYMLHDRLLRAAKVRVRVAPAQKTAESEDASGSSESKSEG